MKAIYTTLAVILMAMVSLNANAQKLGTYQGEVNAGIGFGTDEGGGTKFNIETVHGFRINQTFFAGLGAGFQYYSGDNGQAFMPIYLNGKAYLMDGPIVPFVSLDFGYGIGLSDMGGGLYVSPAAGASFELNNGKALTAALAFQCQKSSTDFGIIKIKGTLNAIALKVAYVW